MGPPRFRKRPSVAVAMPVRFSLFAQRKTVCGHDLIQGTSFLALTLIDSNHVLLGWLERMAVISIRSFWNWPKIFEAFEIRSIFLHQVLNKSYRARTHCTASTLAEGGPIAPLMFWITWWNEARQTFTYKWRYIAFDFGYCLGKYYLPITCWVFDMWMNWPRPIQSIGQCFWSIHIFSWHNRTSITFIGSAITYAGYVKFYVKYASVIFPYAVCAYIQVARSGVGSSQGRKMSAIRPLIRFIC